MVSLITFSYLFQKPSKVLILLKIEEV